MALLHLYEAGLVHLLRLDVFLEEHLLQAGLVHLLDVVIEELLPLGGHHVVGHIPGELLLHASKLVQLLHALPLLAGRLLASGRLLSSLSKPIKVEVRNEDG